MTEVTAVEILLVEDNPYDVELTLRALSEHHLANRVHVVRDGAEALRYLFGDEPNGRRLDPLPKVILLDLKLPLVSGLEVLRRIKADEYLRSTPVVMLTSSREDQDVAATYELGVNSYIVKPVEFEDFVEAVSKLGLYWLVLNQPPG
jgi:two-component system, response regulator